MTDSTLQFVQSHLDADVRLLALQQHRYPDVDMPMALQQISGWQAARLKLPLWASTRGIIFPPHLSMEQCSSQQAAEYKASIVVGNAEGRMADLTGGFGVDAAMLGRHFRHLTFVDSNADLCRMASHNLPLLGIDSLSVIHSTAEEALRSLPHQDLIFVDPSRRDTHGRRTVLIEDCRPDIASLHPALMARTQRVMLKLSPMLDVTALMRSLADIESIHIVSIGGECKELLVVLGPGRVEVPPIHCINITPSGIQRFVHPQADDPSAEHIFNNVDAALDSPLSTLHSRPSTLYLYEPNASIMKAGLFGPLSTRFGIRQLHPNTHLYISPRHIDDFPGRTFSIRSVHTLSKADQRVLRSLGSANIAVRNFPQTPADLRRRLHLTDGGSTYLFATTAGADSQHIILVCQKA